MARTRRATLAALLCAATIAACSATPARTAPQARVATVAPPPVKPLVLEVDPAAVAAAVVAAETKGRVPLPRAGRSRPPSRRGGAPARPHPADVEAALTRIMMCESGGNPTAQNPRSTASGLFQYLRGTWNGYGGYRDAKDAPPELQWQRARSDYARLGGRPWAASRSCWAR